jgi:hypothetical protein
VSGILFGARCLDCARHDKGRNEGAGNGTLPCRRHIIRWPDPSPSAQDDKKHGKQGRIIHGKDEKYRCHADNSATRMADKYRKLVGKAHPTFFAGMTRLRHSGYGLALRRDKRLRRGKKRAPRIPRGRHRWIKRWDNNLDSRPFDIST